MGIGVCLRIGRVYELELREEGREIGSPRRSSRPVLLFGYAVLNCISLIHALGAMTYRRALAFVARHDGGVALLQIASLVVNVYLASASVITVDAYATRRGTIYGGADVAVWRCVAVQST